jgi:hypothetical protein
LVINFSKWHKNTDIFHWIALTFQNLPKFRFLVWKYTIWQHWFHYTPTYNIILALCRHPTLLFSFLHFKNDFCMPFNQVCQMAYFQTKNPNLGIFWRLLQWKMLLYFIDIWSILQPSGIFHWHLVYFVVIKYIFSRFGTLYQGKSGNPAFNTCKIKIPFWNSTENVTREFL